MTGGVRDAYMAERVDACMRDMAALSSLWVGLARGTAAKGARSDGAACVRRVRSRLREMADMLAEPAAREADPEEAREELREATWAN